MATLSTQEILDGAGIRASKTLTRWHQRGLIPKPEIRTHPSGRGKAAYWPSWVLMRCIRIKNLIARGRSLEEIGQLLVSIDSESKYPNCKYEFKEVSANLEFEEAVSEFFEMVSSKLALFSREFGRLDPDLWWRLDRQIARWETVAQILKLARRGFNVVLVIRNSVLEVVPDIALGSLTAADVSASPLVVIPISKEIREAFREVTIGIPETPSIRTKRTILPDGREDFASFELDSKLDFKIRRKRRKKP